MVETLTPKLWSEKFTNLQIIFIIKELFSLYSNRIKQISKEIEVRFLINTIDIFTKDNYTYYKNDRLLMFQNL